MSFGEDAGTNFATARGRDWPSVRQFNVFLANRVGALVNVFRCFDRTDVRILSTTTNRPCKRSNRRASRYSPKATSTTRRGIEALIASRRITPFPHHLQQFRIRDLGLPSPDGPPKDEECDDAPDRNGTARRAVGQPEFVATGILVHETRPNDG